MDCNGGRRDTAVVAWGRGSPGGGDHSWLVHLVLSCMLPRALALPCCVVFGPAAWGTGMGMAGLQRWALGYRCGRLGARVPRRRDNFWLVPPVSLLRILPGGLTCCLCSPSWLPPSVVPHPLPPSGPLPLLGTPHCGLSWGDCSPVLGDPPLGFQRACLFGCGCWCPGGPLICLLARACFVLPCCPFCLHVGCLLCCLVGCPSAFPWPLAVPSG